MRPGPKARSSSTAPASRPSSTAGGSKDSRRRDMSITYTDRIPNNVDLAGDRRLQRALENWQPRFLDWWKELGPDGTTSYDVYLRTAISTDAHGWAQFSHV